METLEMQRLDDGTVRLLNDLGDIVAEFPVEPITDICMPNNFKTAIDWARKNGFAVDHESHWSIKLYRQRIDDLWSRISFGR